MKVNNVNWDKLSEAHKTFRHGYNVHNQLFTEDEKNILRKAVELGYDAKFLYEQKVLPRFTRSQISTKIQSIKGNK